MSSTKKVTNNKLLKVVTIGVIPVMLSVFWILSSLLFINPYGFFSLHNQSLKIKDLKVPEERLLLGEKITGSFQAQENNLGIIVLTLKSNLAFTFEGEDMFVFRIREESSPHWITTNLYSTGLIRKTRELPMGIPKLTDSRGKIYVFEIESKYGNEKNALFVSPSTVKFSEVYTIPKEEILASKKSLLTFLSKKIITQFTDQDFLLRSFTFLLPLLIYLFFLTFIYKFKAPKKLFVIVSLCLIIVDILFLRQQFIGITVFLVLLWAVCINLNKFTYKATFGVAFLMIGLWLVVMIMGITKPQEKLNLWTYLFLVLGTLQIVLDETQIHTRTYKSLKYLRTKIRK